MKLAEDELQEHRAMLWRSLDTEVYRVQHPDVFFQCPQLTNIWGDPRIGKGTKIGAFCEIGDDVQIGDNCTISAYAFICPGTRIFNEVWIGPRVTFTNDKYPPSTHLRGSTVHFGTVIGACATILPGLDLGIHSFVAASSVVAESIWAYDKVMGNPARVYGSARAPRAKYPKK